MRASKLVARPVTLRPKTLQAGPPRATATPNAGQGRGPALTLNGLLRSGSAKGLLSKSDIAPALRVTHPSPAPRHRRGEAAAPLRAHVAAAAAQIRVQLAGHRAGRATEHARCGGGPRRPAIRPSLPAWICAPGSASDRRASAGGGQVTSPGLWTHLARLGEGVVACVGEARAPRSHVGETTLGEGVAEVGKHPPQVPKTPDPEREGTLKQFQTPLPHTPPPGKPSRSRRSQVTPKSRKAASR